MNEQLPDLGKIVQPHLGIDFSTKRHSKYRRDGVRRTRIRRPWCLHDGLGQVRDTVQSHLLQVLALTMLEPDNTSFDSTKLNIFDGLSLASCELWQFDGLLESTHLTYHPSFSDFTFSRVHLSSSLFERSDVQHIIQTGKLTDSNVCTVEVYQRGGPGVLEYDVGREEVGIADIKVSSWSLVDSTSFEAPLPSFNVAPVNSTTHLARVTHANTFFRVWLKRSSRFAACIVLCHFAKIILMCTVHVARAMHMAGPHPSSTSAQHSVPTSSSEREYLLQSATWRFVWPRSAVRRLRLYSHHREEQVLLRLTTLART